MLKTNETSRLQIKIPNLLKQELEKVTCSRIMGMHSNKSTIVSIALANLFREMKHSSLEEICINTYIPLISKGDD